jgi:hypothetical protein
VSEEVLSCSDCVDDLRDFFSRGGAETRRKRIEQKETERTKGGSELIVHQAFWPLPLRPPLILFVAIRAIRGGNVFLVFCHEFHEGHE